MKIVKPLGRSGTRFKSDDPSQLERILITTNKQNIQHDHELKKYIKTTDRAKLAQWVSHPSAPGLISHRAKAIEANTMRLHGQSR